MDRTVTKDPGYPMMHVQMSDLKDTKRIAEDVRSADLMLIRGSETVGYIVSPAHYEALVAAATESDHRNTERFLALYAERHGGLARLDESYQMALRGEFASEDEVAKVFGAS
jgi:hypothetical protein